MLPIGTFLRVTITVFAENLYYTMNMNTPEISIRDIQDSDVLDIYRWRNDSVTIKFSKTGQGVEIKEHYDWFKKIKSTGKGLIQIATVNDKPMGIVIYNYKNEIHFFEISINIAPEFRKLGFGRKILFLSEIKLIKKVGNCKIRAIINEKNEDSINFFTKCKYELIQKNKSELIYEKTLNYKN
jgi:UDP-2,4-diacetamido-2,4,6-trideoxy-beta-L-altropyranose hydrolase